jgi:hypothetical protein
MGGRGWNGGLLSIPDKFDPFYVCWRPGRFIIET